MRSTLRSDSGVSSIQSHSSGSDMGGNSSNVFSLFLLTCMTRCKNRVSLAVSSTAQWQRRFALRPILLRPVYYIWNERLMLISSNYAVFHLFVIILRMGARAVRPPLLSLSPSQLRICIFNSCFIN